jgi:hypothetical protein
MDLMIRSIFYSFDQSFSVYTIAQCERFCKMKEAAAMAGCAGEKEKLQLCTNHGNATVQNFGSTLISDAK